MSGRDLRWLTSQIEGAQAYHRGRVDALYAGRPPREVIAIAGRTFGRSHGLSGNNDLDMLREPDAWLDDVLSDMAAHAEEAADPVTFRPLVIEVDPIGVHFIDALFGARTYFREGQAWADELDCDPAELSMPDLARCGVLHRSLELARRAVAVSRGRLCIATPVFSCPINIGINLFGQRVLEALVERPAAARQALGVISDVIGECVRAFAAIIPDEIRRNSVAATRYAPGGFGQIDGCATQLVSREHYQEFFAPLDGAILAAWPHGGMIHLCGAHAHHIPAWREMREVRSVQLNDRATEDVGLYFDRLRSDQILYVTPTGSGPVERIVEVTGGERLILQCELPQPVLASKP